MLMEAPSPWEAAARLFEPEPPREQPWATPGEMAKTLDAKTIQTPALDLIDAALVDVAEGRCKRLMLHLPPQEGKVNGPVAGSRSGRWSVTLTSASRSCRTRIAWPVAGAGSSATTSRCTATRWAWRSTRAVQPRTSGSWPDMRVGSTALGSRAS